MKRENLKLPLIGIFAFVLYFVQNFATELPLILFGINYSEMALTSKVIYLLVYEFIFILSLFLIFKNKIKNDFKDYINNFKPYMKKYLEYWAFAFALMVFANVLIVTLLPNSTATNQEAVNELFNKVPIYIIISSVLYAPIIEELVFRLSFRYMFKNNVLFIISSGLVFGTMHVVGSFTSFIDLVYIIPYSIPGLVFAYTLYKSENIFVPIFLHFFHNGLMMAAQVALLFL